MKDDIKVKDNKESAAVEVYFNLKIRNPESGAPLGTLLSLKENKDGELTFEGNTDESAEAFFNGVVAYNSATISRYKIALERIACNCTDVVCRDIAKNEL